MLSSTLSRPTVAPRRFATICRKDRRWRSTSPAPLPSQPHFSSARVSFDVAPTNPYTNSQARAPLSMMSVTECSGLPEDIRHPARDTHQREGPRLPYPQPGQRPLHSPVGHALLNEVAAWNTRCRICFTVLRRWRRRRHEQRASDDSKGLLLQEMMPTGSADPPCQMPT